MEPRISWKRGARLGSLDPAAVYRELEAIRTAAGGTFGPGDVLAAAADGRAPEIAKALESDDAKAAAAWRLEQVRHVIRSLSVIYVTVHVTTPDDEPRRAVVLVHPEPGQRGYLPRPIALRDHAAELRERGIQALRTWLVQYGDVPGLESLREDIAKLLERTAL